MHRARAGPVTLVGVKQFERPLLGVVLVLCLAASGCTDGASARGDSVSEDPSAVGADWPSASREALVEQYRSGLTELAEINRVDNPPEVDLVRFVTPPEWADAQIGCLQEHGYTASESQGGVKYPEVPQEQADSLNLAIYTCEAAYALDPRVNNPIPRARMERQFSHLADVVMPCVAGLGFQVEEPPTLETWLDAYYGNGQIWDPFSSVPGEELDSVYKECPHDVEGLYPEVPTANG